MLFLLHISQGLEQPHIPLSLGTTLGAQVGEDQLGLPAALHGQEAQLGGSSTQIHFWFFLKDDYYDYYYCSAQAP